ncbi:hypothetical protein RND81_11G002000 [Saponaria officinalis]|uniref:Exocyst subunit Exo70 family protein n=1 Tax=Saponaria officinalis TaxID=3572 RepID=A0AAW1HGM3_SAPOF
MEKNLLPAKSISFNDGCPSDADKDTVLDNSSSFSFYVDRRHSLHGNYVENGDAGEHHWNLNAISEEIDGLIEKLSSVEDVSDLPDIPPSVEKFSKMVQSEIGKYDAGDSTLKFGDDTEQDTRLLNAMSRVSKLSNLLSKFSSSEKVSPLLTMITLAVQRAMTFMEEELRIIMENPTPVSKTPKSADFKDHKQGEDEEGNNYPRISEEKIANMRKIVALMISGGYETECCQVYSIVRGNAFKEAMKQQGFEIISVDEVQKMPWETLEGHIGTWIRVVKYVAKVLLPREKTLCDSVFSHDHPQISKAMFSNLIRSTVILFLNFAEAIAITKRSAERLFKVLDIYETLTELMSALDETCSHECANELMSEISSVRRQLGEAAVCIFCDLENSIKNDVAGHPVPSGAVHPLTRYTMNYLRYACDFKDTLEQVFSLHCNKEQHTDALEPRSHDDKDENSEESGVIQAPFALELMTIMNLLDANLEAKSKLYKDPSLRSIFLMNNGRYILQKIKESAEIHELVGNTSCRKRSSELRGYHKSYQRETWSRVLQCLNQEGLQVNGKVQKPVLKERFKSFNQMFDEIHKTQSCWVVSDEQLQSELRVSISAVMIPAYRSFLARFGQYFTSGRQSEKFIKYQPEDIESTIERLFDGNQSMSMSRRKS